MQHITYFGYGSLVNRATRPPAEQAHPCRLYGWRRVWGHRVTGSADASSGARTNCCSLSIEPVSGEFDAGGAAQNSDSPGAASNAYIDGVLVTIPASELPALDQRESGYDRLQLSADHFLLPPSCHTDVVHVYVSDALHAGRSNEHYPVLQSYIDCVMAGYWTVFDHDGMQHFVDSTNGWDGVIKNERAEPKYPRAVQLSRAQLHTIDALVSQRRSRADLSH